MIIDLSSSISMNSRRKSKQSKNQKQTFAKSSERSLNKKKQQIRKFYDVIEILRLEKQSNFRQIVKHLFKKSNLINQFSIDTANLQKKQFRKIDDRFNQFENTFNDRFN